MARQMTMTRSPAWSLDGPVTSAFLVLLLGLVGGIAATVGLRWEFVVVGALGLVVFMVITHFGRVHHLGPSLLYVTALLTPWNGVTLTENLEVGDLFLYAAIGVYLLIRLREGKAIGGEPTYLPVVNGVLVLALGGFIGALVGSTEPFTVIRSNGLLVLEFAGVGRSLGTLPLMLSGTLGPLALWALARANRLQLQRAGFAFVVGACASVGVGYAFPSLRHAGRLRGLALHPIHFGNMCIFALAICLAFVLSAKKPPVWALAAMPVLLAGIVGSGARSSLGGLVVFAALTAAITRRKVVFAVLLTGTAAVLLAVGLGFLTFSGEDAISRALNPNSVSSSLSTEGRDELVSRTIDRWLQRPFTGNGLAMMAPSHNVYIGLLASAGALGVLGFALVVRAVVKRAWLRRTDAFLVCATLGYIAYLGAAFFDNSLWLRWIWFYIGYLVALGATKPGPGEAGYEPEPVVARAAAGVPVRSGARSTP